MRTTHVYKTVRGQELRADCIRSRHVTGSPVALWIHGGAFVAGDRRQLGWPLRWSLRRLGFSIVSIDYRLAPATKLSAIVEDVEDAVRWVQRSGNKLGGIDTARLAIIGASAGGYLALRCLGLNPPPRAIISVAGQGDLSLLGRGAAPGASTWFKEVTGWDGSDSHDLDVLNPAGDAGPHSPPTLLIHGTRDGNVPYFFSREMAESLSKTGASCHLFTLETGGHELAEVLHGYVRWINCFDLFAMHRRIEDFLRQEVL